MKIIRSPAQMSKVSRQFKRRGLSLGLVPTMGALHEGHLSLMRRAREENDKVCVSIFVNPAQFGPREDFSRYPRNFRKDAAACRKVGVDVIFYPDAARMYPSDFKTYICVKELGNVLCGRSRPGHFEGVATVVTKLFNIAGPDRAYFGQKDAQQAIIIRRVARDLNMPVGIKVLPIVREKDGLAMSSRNRYLSAAQRKDALVLHESLNKAKAMLRQGVGDSGAIVKKIKTFLAKTGSARIDYVAIVDPGDLKPVTKIKDKALLALAVWIGKTRLIDNAVLKV
ncbi:MAG: pantoate--beta-alanine ligase [Deltaproteobacteria bacterium]